MMVDERIWALFKRNWQHTLTYWSVFFSFGLSIAFLGPTILDLKCQTQTTLQQITWVFFSQQLFVLIGTSLGGLFRKTLYLSLSMLFLCTLTISVVFAIIPLCHHLAALTIAMAFSGMAMGVIDTTANLQLVKLYQKDSAVFLQVLHFFIGLGALVSPLVADPFLAEGDCNSTASSPPYLQPLRSSTLPGTLLHNVSNHTEGVVITNVSYAFWIMAVINLPVPIAVCVLMYRDRLIPFLSYSPRLLAPDPLASKTPREQTPTDINQNHRGMLGSCNHGSLHGCCNHGSLQGRPPTFFLLHIVGGAILFLTDGIIGLYSGFIYTYAVSSPLSMSHKIAGYLTSVFWASICAGRLGSIYLSWKFTHVRLLTVSLMGVMVVVTMMLIFYSSGVFLFIGTCVMGLCISSVFPCMIAFTEDILEYKGCATTFLVTSASTGEMLLQVVMGSVMERQGSYSFQLCAMISAWIGFALFLVFFYVQHSYRRHHTDTGTSKDISMTEQTSDRGVKQ